MENPHVVRILSFDPGTTNMGWAISELNLNTADFNVLAYGIVKASKIAKKRKEAVEEFGPRLISLSVVDEEATRLILQYQPHYISTEDTFFNAGTPQAHISLLLCINTIERAMYNLFHSSKLDNPTAKKLYKLAPSTIKMVISGHGGSIKQQVIDSVMNNPQIYFAKLTDNKDTIENFELIEHEADAIAVGYSLAKTVLI